MTSARKDLCAELYQLSNWKSGVWHTESNPTYGYNLGIKEFDAKRRTTVPKYDMAFLYKRLAAHHIIPQVINDGIWKFKDDVSGVSGRGSEPADAMIDLCINLFKDGKLQKESI